MRLMKRNLVTIYYSLYKGREPLLDAQGDETGEYSIIYDTPRKLQCSVSPAVGNIQLNIFGSLDTYDKVLITDDKGCLIDENSVLYIDCKPGFGSTPDYIVKGVAKSINTIMFAISKVEVR